MGRHTSEQHHLLPDVLRTPPTTSREGNFQARSALVFLAFLRRKSTSGVLSASMYIWYEKRLFLSPISARFAQRAARPRKPLPNTFGKGAGTPRIRLIRNPLSTSNRLRLRSVKRRE